MITADDFSNIYSKEKISELVEEGKKGFYYENAYRIIKHTVDVEVTKTDFYPSVMERNDFEMPTFDIQNSIEKIGDFGVSCLDTLDHMKSFIETVTSFRENYEKNGWFIMKGKVQKGKGFASTTNRNGHFNYYLFDPINKNPIDDFIFIKEEEKNE